MAASDIKFLEEQEKILKEGTQVLIDGILPTSNETGKIVASAYAALQEVEYLVASLPAKFPTSSSFQAIIQSIKPKLLRASKYHEELVRDLIGTGAIGGKAFTTRDSLQYVLRDAGGDLIKAQQLGNEALQTLKSYQATYEELLRHLKDYQKEIQDLTSKVRVTVSTVQKVSYISQESGRIISAAESTLYELDQIIQKISIEDKAILEPYQVAIENIRKKLARGKGYHEELSQNLSSTKEENYQELLNFLKQYLEELQSLKSKLEGIRAETEALQKAKEGQKNLLPTVLDFSAEALLQALSDEQLDVAMAILEHHREACDPSALNAYGLNALHMLAMVHRDMDVKKVQQVKTIFEKFSTHGKFKQAINEPCPTDGRTPLTLTLAFPETVQWTVQLYELFSKAEAVCKSNEPIWAVWMGSTNYQDKLTFFDKTFPGEFTFQKLTQKSTVFLNRSALSAAVQIGDTNLVKFVYEKGKEDWVKIMDEERMLHTALNRQPINCEMVAFLLDHGANPKVKYGERDFHQQLEWMRKRPEEDMREQVRLLDEFLIKRAASTKVVGVISV